MKKIKYLFFMALILTVIRTNAQTLSENTLNIIRKNIISYHFRKALDYDLNIQGSLLSDNQMFFEELWNGPDHTLQIEVENVSLSYPLKNFTLYHVIKKGYRFTGDKSDTFRKLSSLDFDEDYLIALNRENSDLKFISGNFFQSRIADDFQLKASNHELLIQYLFLKFYNFLAKDIKFQKMRKGCIYFTGSVGLNKTPVVFMIKEKDFDDTKIVFLNKTIGL